MFSFVLVNNAARIETDFHFHVGYLAVDIQREKGASPMCELQQLYLSHMPKNFLMTQFAEKRKYEVKTDV